MKKRIVFFDIDYTLFNTDVFKTSNLTRHKLYGEVTEVLEKIGTVSELGILSEGETAFQTEKLVRTQIEKHFGKDHVFIVPDKMAELSDILKKYKEYKLYLVDDRLSVLEKSKQLYPKITTIWVKRGPFANADENAEFIPDFMISDLSSLFSIVSS